MDVYSYNIIISDWNVALGAFSEFFTFLETSSIIVDNTSRIADLYCLVSIAHRRAVYFQILFPYDFAVTLKNLPDGY